MKNKMVDNIIRSILCWNIWSFLVVEILSAINCLNKTGILLGWGSFAFIWLIKNLRLAKKMQDRWNLKVLAIRRSKAKDFILGHKLICLVAFAVLFLALLTVPYNSDSITYHLPRMAHWAQNQTVAHYASNDIRQVASPVLAEFVNVQVYILSGKRDFLLNLLQACSYITNAYLIFEIAIKIGCRYKMAVLSSLLFMSMPIAFGEALNTQVDLFAANWMLIFVYYFIDLYKADSIECNKDTIEKCVIMGFCISFGYLSKPAVDLGMAFLLVILLVKCIARRDRIISLCKLAISAGAAVIVPLIPEFIRNYQTFSALASSETGAKQLVGTLRPAYLLVNCIKNFAQNWSNIYMYNSWKWMEHCVFWLAAHLKLNINDASISENGMEYFMHMAPMYDHDKATNPVVIIFGTMSFLYAIWQIRKKRSIGNSYTIIIFAMFILFCAVVRWEPFVSRYMLPYLGLICPSIAYQIQEIKMQRNAVIEKEIIAVIYFLCVVDLLGMGYYHSGFMTEYIASRQGGYFIQSMGVKNEYIEALNEIKQGGYQKIGIKLDGRNVEYPIWAILGNSVERIECVKVENETKKYEDNSFKPDCVITNGQLESIIEVNGKTYEELVNKENISIYVPRL